MTDSHVYANPGAERFQGLFLLLALFLFAALPLASVSGEGEAGIRFDERAEAAGLEFTQQSGSLKKDYIVEAKGAGVVMVDVNQDGYDDIYLVNARPRNLQPNSEAPANRLYINDQKGGFRDETESSGLGDDGHGLGAAFADIDNDGDMDAYVANFGPNQLYINQGDGRFLPAPGAGGAQCLGMSSGVAFGDVNGDGFLDLYVANYAEFDYAGADAMGTLGRFEGIPVFLGPSSFSPASDRLFINKGDGTFSDESDERGLNTFVVARSFTPALVDFDDDGDLDIFVSGDTTSNILYQNDGNGHFEDVSLIAGVGFNQNGLSQGCMGVAVNDGDGDGDMDIFVVNYQGETNVLYENLGNMTFQDSTIEWGLNQDGFDQVSFGVLWEDFDNDGDPDIHIANGHVYPAADQIPRLEGYAQRDLFFLNMNRSRYASLSFEEHAFLQQAAVSRGSACGDFDGDGDLDIVINNLDAKPFLLVNQSDSGNWLQLALLNEYGAPAFGATVEVKSGDFVQSRTLLSCSSFLSQSSAVIHFGFDGSDNPVQVKVKWPGGQVQMLDAVRLNQRISIRRNSGLD